MELGHKEDTHWVRCTSALRLRLPGMCRGLTGFINNSQTQKAPLF
ncbi:unnamed protein product [Tetraodon nigroviridis]|uniref:(spotted green pufferfish) hypothetical protein n=1 Tax=Tetraodon nigroviridis TaxID=99883 RepID=Q4RRN0_TETNG|nr:unnamed protein product [Tetraodon nigroviridis]